MLYMMDPEDRCDTPEKVDQHISAQLPDPTKVTKIQIQNTNLLNYSQKNQLKTYFLYRILNCSTW